MMFICDLHGRQDLVPVSPRFKQALEAGQSIPADWVCLVIVQDETGTTRYHMDVNTLQAAGLDPSCGPIVLKDRDVQVRRLNDRLIIQKLFPSLSAPVERSCKACLAQTIDPLSPGHLKAPPQRQG